MAGEPQDASRPGAGRTRQYFDLFSGKVVSDAYPRPSVIPIFQGPPGLDPVATIGGQAYRQVDNGRANRLVPTGGPSPVELAQRRAAADRALFMTRSPLAGAAYGIATLAGASPQARDDAMVAGGVADAAMLGAAPFGARIRPLLQAPATLPPWESKLREAARYGLLTDKGQATGVNATITQPMLGTGMEANRTLRPPGWLGNGRAHNQARGHLLGRQLGGAGQRPEEVVTLTQNPTNSPQMRDFENAVARRVGAGEVVEYFVNPLYSPKAPAPSWMAMTAQGSRGGFTPKIIQNPAGTLR